MGIKLLSKETITREDVAEYILEVENLADAVDVTDMLQSAMDNSREQLDYILELRDKIRSEQK